jgi:hypothetical protein
MRRRLALMIVFGVVSAFGCTPTGTVQSTAWLPRRHFFQGPSGPDVVHMRVALLESQPGESEWRYLTSELWQLADESLVDEDRRHAMTESGFRVGKVAAPPPARLLTLLTSSRFNPTPRELTFRAGDPKALAIGPTLPHCRYRVEDGEPITLDSADCKLVVAASRGSGDKTLLRITPQVVHGDTRNSYHGDAQSGWAMVAERPTETYPQMAWEAELALNEYLLIGGDFDRLESVGHQFFVRPDETIPVQRLLVIQMGAAPQGPAAQPAGSGAQRSVPLALQATWSSARGAAP